jgi:hypothetical protein
MTKVLSNNPALSPDFPDRAPRTAAFKRWFGGSKVVDKRGKPLVVFHGSNRPFYAFDYSRWGKTDPGFAGKGFYFIDHMGYARAYAEMDADPSDAPAVLAVYLRMENPLVVMEYGEIPGATAGRVPTREQAEDMTQRVRAMGYDGVIVAGKPGNPSEYVVFDPSQIKSATDNRGTFDAADPDIRHNPKTARRTDPAIWERIVAEVTASDKGGRPGQWSARKAQFAVALYKQRGGGYIGPKTPDNALTKWTREEWRTRSGLPSLETGERYLPARAITALTASEYAATSKRKRAGMRRGQQFIPQPESVAMKTSKYRRNPPNPRTVTQVTKAAREALGDPNLEFVRGDGYFYVLYGETGMTDGFAYGGRVSAQSLDRWVREIREAIAKAER